MFASGFIESGYNILDACCGVGYGSYLMSLSSEPSRIDAFDRSGEAIEIAKANYYDPRINYVCESFENISLIPSFYDLITCFEAIEHVENPNKLLMKLSQSLSADGNLILSTPNNLLMPFDKQLYPEHVKHFTIGELDNLLFQNELTIKKVYSQPDRCNVSIKEGSEGQYLILICIKR
jgi:2-polyprenyl-3-methyl-5-hydroxy-6-metoxy-1,4-benzoquinol methylase